jgi:hypothetical protein
MLMAAQTRTSVSDRTWDDAVAELLDTHYLSAVRHPAVATV